MIGRAATFTLAVLVALPAAAGAQASEPSTPSLGSPEFLTASRFHMGASRLGAGDERFEWDARFRGEIDVMNYGLGRVNFLAEYGVILGHQLRSFDPNQSIYTLEVRATRRFGLNEVAGLFHHVSRHLTDRAKVAAIDWNLVGAEVQRLERVGQAVVDASLRAGWIVKRSSVDYSWHVRGRVGVERPIASRVTIIGEGAVLYYGTDASLAGRGLQVGALGEGGVRLSGRRAALDLVLAVERRVDADPLMPRAEQWVSVGFRLLTP